MVRDLEHLALPEWNQYSRLRNPQNRNKFGSVDPAEEGPKLLQQITNMRERLEQRRQTTPEGINPAFVFKLKLRPGTELDEDYLRRMGLHFLAQDADNALVVFPDQATLDALRDRARQYSGEVEGNKYQELNAIEDILDLTPEDRTGPRLVANPIGSDEILALDVELWHTGNDAECRQRIAEISDYLERRALKVTDSYIGRYICVLRAKVDQAALSMLLNLDSVKEVERRPEPTFDMLRLYQAELANFVVDADLPDDLVGILILDSGITARHPMLAPAIGDAQIFLNATEQPVTGGVEDGDNVDGGHGTAVAGIAAYSDVYSCIENHRFRASALLFSGRITDDNNSYAEDLLLESQLRMAVEYFVNNYPMLKVVNISLGNSHKVFADRLHQYKFAAAIDELAYAYRDRQLLFVISAGNYTLEGLEELDGEEVYGLYPGYLLDGRARVIDPATAALAITVGGLSNGEGRMLWQSGRETTDRLIGEERGWPSAFTRTGWGVGGSIKPEVVEYAGTYRLERGKIRTGDTFKPGHSGVSTTSKAFATEGTLFHSVAGTSFAAPKVANLAARLFREFPQASANLIRALIGSSARIPQNLPRGLDHLEAWDEDILRIYGYGQPDFDRARYSDTNDVLLVNEGELYIADYNTFQIFTIPSLPDEFLAIRTKPGYPARNAYVSVTLAYDPPTRYTRLNDYLGVAMEFKLFRNATPDQVLEALRFLAEDEKNAYRENEQPIPNARNLRSQVGLPPTVDLRPGIQRRKKGTLQKGIVKIAGTNWEYNGGPLVLAVMCRRVWASADIVGQGFAVVARIHHDDEFINLYEHVQQQTSIYLRAQARVGR